MTFDKKRFSSSNGGESLVAELSDLEWMGERVRSVPSQVTVSDHPCDGEDTTFSFYRVDENEGDIAGWHFHSRSGHKLLIIND